MQAAGQFGPASGRVNRVHGPPAELRTRLVQAAYEAAVAEGRYEAPQARRAHPRARLYRDGRLTLLAPFFDYAFYAFENPDFEATGLDELEHYNFFGWRRLRHPTAWFDTAYYLASNPDVRASGDNPFWHYIFKGRAEGRAPQRPRAAERAVLADLTVPEARFADATPPDLPRLSADALVDALRDRLATAQRLVLSVAAAEPYADEADAGAFIDAERRNAAARGDAHLHIAPLRASGVLKTMPALWSETQFSLGGEMLGVATDADIAKALSDLRDALPEARALLVHGLLGLSVEGLLAIEAAFAPTERRYWLHDFSSLCPGQKLLRNDVAFCGAPPPESEACAICIYGEARRTQLSATARLFERCNFSVIAPSATTLDIWRQATSLPFDSAVVREPADLQDIAGPQALTAPGDIGVEGQPVRVAFLGAPALAEGWLTFERILATCGELVAYAFHHFADPEDLRPSRNLFNVAADMSAQAPNALRDALIARRIDLVVMAAEWPRSFSFAAMEALAAGCDLVTLGRSGHIAELAEGHRRGRLFESDDDVVAFFASGRAIAYARERARFPRLLSDVRRLAP